MNRRSLICSLLLSPFTALLSRFSTPAEASDIVFPNQLLRDIPRDMRHEIWWRFVIDDKDGDKWRFFGVNPLPVAIRRNIRIGQRLNGKLRYAITGDVEWNDLTYGHCKLLEIDFNGFVEDWVAKVEVEKVPESYWINRLVWSNE